MRDLVPKPGAWLCVGALLVAVSVVSLRAQTYDVVIVNGRVLDPESNLDAVRSVGITGGRIAAVSPERLTGRTTIDATGAIVVPGFIDLHAHGQAADVYKLRASDGVTTALELEVGAADIDAWYRQRESGQVINYGVSVGHIPVRMAVLRDAGAFLPTGPGAHQAASAGEIAEIVRRIEQGLDRGAVSIGAGFVYTPAASRDELLAVFGVAGRRRTPVHAHTRRGLPGVEEAIGLAAETKAPLHVVHVNSTSVGATREVLAVIDRARKQGMDVTTEAYPYTAGMTEIQSANLDEYVGAPAERLALLEWPRTGERSEPGIVREVSEDRWSGRPAYQHRGDGEGGGDEPADDDCERRLLGERDRSPANDGNLCQGARPLRARAAGAHADGRDQEDDTDAGAAPRGAGAGDEDEGSCAHRAPTRTSRLSTPRP